MEWPSCELRTASRVVVAELDEIEEALWMATYADDLEIGKMRPLGRHTLERADIIDFAREWDPISLHTDPVAAAESPLGDVVASGLQTLAVYQRLVVEALWADFAGGIGQGFEIRFVRPVFPGTTLTGTFTVRSVNPRPERGDAKVEIEAELVNDDGEVVLAVTNWSVLPLRPN